MYYRLTRRLITLLAVLTVFISLGMGESTASAVQGIQAKAAAEEAAESRVERLAELVRAAAKYSGCTDRSFFEKPSCYREFGEKAVKVGAGVGLFAYGMHEGHKDTVKHFGNLEKGIAGFAELKDILQQDPSKIADPTVRAQAEAQVRTALNGAKKDIDKVFADVIETIGTVLVLVEFVLLMVNLTLTLAQLVGDPGFQKAANGVRTGLEGIGKDLDRINAGLAKMGGALDDMNGAVDEINSGLGQMNRGIAQANRGMDKLNQGLADSNKAVKDVNKHIPDIKKAAAKLRGLPGIDFDFSHIGDTWSSGTSGLSTAEQERRMSLVLDLLPGIGDGKGVVEAITGKDMMTGEQLSGFDRALGALVVMRWVRVGKKVLDANDIRDARKGLDAVTCNSFPQGTPVVMADGTRKRIEDIRPGDEVLATAPEGAPADSPFTRARPVLSRVVTASDKEFTRLTTDAGSVTSTGHHLYWATDLREWLRADELKPGNRLLDATGRETAVAATDSFVQEQITYDLDVSGIDSYYVGVGESSALVHNCTDLVKDAGRFPGLAHTLDEHVDVDLDRMKELAIEKTRRRGRPTPNSRWTDRQTAQQVVDYAVAGNKARIDKWLREGARQPLELKGTFGAKNSLGDVMTHTGQHSKAGNGYVVLLQRAPGHKPGGYYVSTAYPV
ncbi:hypothetical protein B5180_25045 [Streptomyces sp. BF-3]|nr:hypothetical protein B5180_25045 [Streptomyces sp. BF-3]